MRGSPTNPSRYCIALTESGDPCGRNADHRAAPRSTEDLEGYIGQPLCAVHYHQLHQHFLGPDLIELEEDLEPDPPSQPIRYPDQPEPLPQDDGYVYFARHGDRVKIGFSIAPERRIATLQTQGGLVFDDVVWIEAQKPLERHYHKRFSDSRTIGEWFSMTPELQEVMQGLAEFQPAR